MTVELQREIAQRLAHLPDFPLFVIIGDAESEGPFLVRRGYLLPVAERTAWALLRQAYLNGIAPALLPTHSPQITRDTLESHSHLIWQADAGR